MKELGVEQHDIRFTSTVLMETDKSIANTTVDIYNRIKQYVEDYIPQIYYL